MNNDKIELSIVSGETSGLFTVDSHTGGVDFSPDVSFEQWREVLRLAKTIKRKAAVMVADCIAFGVPKWGATKVDEALEQLEFEATLVKAAIAINSVPRTLRFDNLEPDHYVELSKAKLDKKAATRWARIASEQRLTPTQLRFSIAEGEVVDRTVAKQQSTGIYTIHGIRQEFDVWARRVGGLEGVKAMDADHQIEIMEELAAICEFGFALNNHIAMMQEQTGQPVPAA
jgi:hypothetical protein